MFRCDSETPLLWEMIVRTTAVSIFGNFSYYVVNFFIGVLATSLSPVAARTDFQKREWKFLKPVNTFILADSSYIRIPLDPETYDHSQWSLADLRLADDGQNEIPYVLYEHQAKTEEEAYSPKFYNLSVRPEAYSIFTLDLGKEAPNNKLMIKTGSKDFKRRVEISGSPEGRNWLLVKKDAYIFDFRGGENIQLTTVHYPENHYRFLQVKVWNGKDDPLELQGATVYLTKVTQSKRVPRAYQLISREEDAKPRTTVCLLDLKYQNIPFDLLQVETPEENFSRLIEIWVSQEGKEWQRQAQSEFYRFRVSHFSSEKKTFTFPEARKRYMKVVIYNQDDPPLHLTSFEIQGVEKDIIFQPRSGQQYRLYYGNPRGAAPHYDLARLSAYLPLEDLQQVGLGSEAVNPEYAPLPPWKPWTERYPVFFWTILVFLVVSLGVYVVRLMLAAKTV